MTSASPKLPMLLLGQPPSLRDLNLICWGLFFTCFVLPFSIIVLNSHRPPAGNFAGFYSLGRILNEHPASELYDFDLQRRICSEVEPRSLPYGPLPYPPFVGLFFRPFALLPYWFAYLLWSLISLGLYAGGITITLGRFFPQERLRRSLLLCLGFAYCPFIVDTASNGQLAAVGFFALSLALREDDLDHPLRSGVMLSICAYKPTLLLLLLPMLLVTRRWKALLGFAAGATALAVVTSAVEGLGVWPRFVGAMLSFGRASVAVNGDSMLVLAKYIDITSFSHLVHGGRSWPGLAIAFVVACWALISLLTIWWKSPRMGRPARSLVWATTLTWTLLLNVYVPIYDSILIVLALIVTAGSLQHIGERTMQRWFTVNWVLILAGSWFTVAVAGATGVQLLTLLFVAFGVLQFAALRKLAGIAAPSTAHREV